MTQLTSNTFVAITTAWSGWINATGFQTWPDSETTVVINLTPTGVSFPPLEKPGHKEKPGHNTFFELRQACRALLAL